MLSIPPEKLISIAVAPLVTPAKSALRIVTKKASTIPRDEAENIVTIFESPGLAPGGSPGRGGIRLSKKESDIAKAPIMPSIEIC